MRATFHLDTPIPTLRIETDGRGDRRTDFCITISHTYATAKGTSSTVVNTFSGFTKEDLDVLSAVINTMKEKIDGSAAQVDSGSPKRLRRSGTSGGREALTD